MFEKDGICYADNLEPALKIIDMRFLDGWKVLATFNNGESRTTDFQPLLSSPAFRPLRDRAAFSAGTLDFGTLTWQNGEIDIASEWVYEHGKTIAL